MPDYFRTLIASEYFQKLADFANAGYGLYFAFAFSVFLYVVWVVIAVVTIIFEWAWNCYNDKSSGFQLEELSKLDPELLNRARARHMGAIRPMDGTEFCFPVCLELSFKKPRAPHSFRMVR